MPSSGPRLCPMRGHGAGRLLAALLLTICAAPVAAQDAGGPGLGGPGAVRLPSATETLLVDGLDLEVTGTTGDLARDDAITGGIRSRLGIRAGDRIGQIALDTIVGKLQTTPGIGSARARLVPAAGDATRVRVAVEVTLAPDTGVAADPTGMLAGEGLAGFPVIWRSETGGLRFILNGGAGVFTDGNPWFGNPDAFTLGNPLVQDPSAGADTGDRIAWFEQWIEGGLAGAVQLGDSNAAVYGALTAIAPFSTGQDIFRDDTRSTVDVEKAYAGIVWSDPARELSFNLSLGRQNYTLNDGFLISQFGSQWNAGPRPGIYMAPRTTHDFAAVGTVKAGDWTVTGFYLDPNEYEPFESDTTVAGANLRYNFTESFFADASVFAVPESKTRYAAPSGPVGTREGLTTYAAHVRWADRERAPGLWVEGEIAHQRHSDFEMDAWAGYATVGYLARDLPWTPSLSYRVSGFTGDDPSTSTYERFDALYSGGLGEWLQGISLGKVLRPENRISHRVRLNVAPNPRLNLTLDYVLHSADELNNIGANPAIAQLSSRDLGQEVQFVTRWAVSDQLYFLGVAAMAFPGDAIRDAAGGDADNWTTLQAQLFWTF